jgi:hypothetical protein
LREIAVFGGTAHPALAAEIGADLGVRCAASQASSAAAWPCCPVAAPNSANLHDESPDELARAAKTWKTSRPPGVVVSSASCRDRNPVPRRRSGPRW